ncbi:LAP4 protein [Zea mays]|uniref:LAP4 protein n=1 Tax=Zea mays TaxID=4577 RepID=A0A1D6JSQ3_MAIZE|nr:LAP4 protein [Zea mays]
MGCCSSRSSDSPASRVTRWRSTGIVALRDARLKEVPNEVLQVGNSLRTLDLTNNKLVEIPQEIGTLANMQRLVLAGNLIEIIPANIGYLQNLKILTLDRNRISILPEELGSLSNLQQLSVPQNFLLCLPKSIGDLRNSSSSGPFLLKNGRSSLDTGACCSSLLLSILSGLDHSRDLLQKRSFVVGHRHGGDGRMSVLNVSDNKLKELPESIGGCSSLEEFQANASPTSGTDLEAKYSGNAIEDVPASICNLVCLKSLSLNGNKIRQLPQNLLKDCTALQSLSLHDNPITMDQFQQMDGFGEFEARRRKKFDKQIDSGVMMGSTALDEGVDFH